MKSDSTTPTVHVAVGVIKNEQGEIFIAKRLNHQHQGGKWEFPGGKVEQGEAVTEALVRELKEECNIAVTDCAPLTVVEHQYADKRVLLDVWWVLSYTGTAQQMEGQEYVWADIAQLDAYQFPDANQPIVDCLMDAQSN
ncbi:8-oxo-dGTPase [Idiomarina fontislapidosi]|uniref:8-oxo-dGTP diphosphatase n=1 Tax=Idiomarina fontislapidosi TaxID=263723 RepID=A0A432Y2D1_9GAMM|nr:8-oxo-dGTP diphosphatase MutT [Idiomarina fontislapidosi]PYE33273.1 8-oxo-dGTPase [Idiomarina fontislapidosi]RUO55110.1 8-oxo-dGTP diphosphatase MutT [Idiomarina fontislapidosi]